MFYELKADFNRYFGDRGIITRILCFTYYLGIYACIIYRVCHYFYKKSNNRLFKIIYYLLFILLYTPFKFITGVEIHPQAKIGRGLFIPHCTSIVISKEAIIGEFMTIHQCCTIGVNYLNMKAPVLGSNVLLGCNVSIIGGIEVGNNVSVLPNSTVTKSFPSKTIVGGVPAKIIKQK